MAGVFASLTTIGLDDAIRRLGSLDGFQIADLADEAGALLESSTRGRFDTQTAPDGTPWPDWSEDYAATRGGHHSLLVGEGDLRDTIASYSTGAEVHVGSNLIYAAPHHFGGDEIGSGIPARSYLGISDQDAADLQELVTGKLEEVLL